MDGDWQDEGKQGGVHGWERCESERRRGEHMGQLGEHKDGAWDSGGEAEEAVDLNRSISPASVQSSSSVHREHESPHSVFQRLSASH